MRRSVIGFLFAAVMLGSMSSVTIAEEQKYQELYDLLEAGQYDEAISFIQDLKAADAPALPEDLSDYLLEIEITEENFNDYFDIQYYYLLNDFGERSDSIRAVFTSKMYDQGYYLYEMDDIPIEFAFIRDEGLDSRTETLDENIFSSGMPVTQESEWKLVRLKPGKAVFIKKEAVQAIDEGRYDLDHETIRLVIKHGDEEEELYRYYYDGFEY